MITKKMYTHLLGEEEDAAEVVEGEWEGVEVDVGMDTWSMLMVVGRVTMLLLMQAMGMLTMLLLMRAMVMHVVEAVVLGAVAGEVAMVAILIINKMVGEVAMAASMIISTMEGITTRHQHHPEVVAVVSGAVVGEVAMVASLSISRMEGITKRHLLHQPEVVVAHVGEAQPGAEGVVAMPMVWCTRLLPVHKLLAAPPNQLPLVGCLLQV